MEPRYVRSRKTPIPSGKRYQRSMAFVAAMASMVGAPFNLHSIRIQEYNCPLPFPVPFVTPCFQNVVGIPVSEGTTPQAFRIFSFEAPF